MSKKVLTDKDIETKAVHQTAIQIAEIETAKQIAEDTPAISTPTTQERENLIAEAYRLGGRAEAFNAISEFANISSLIQLKKIKENKVYKEMPNIKTWDNFCKSMGFSRTKIDEDLENLDLFGADFISNVNSLGIGYRELRQLKKATKDNVLSINGNDIILEGEVISMDNKDHLKEALEDLVSNQQAKLKEATSELKASNEVVKTYAVEKDLALKALDKSEKKAEQYKNKLNTIYQGRLGDVAEDEREDFQTIANLEIEFTKNLAAAVLLHQKGLSKFNGDMFCATLTKMMVGIDDLRIKATEEFQYNFDAGVLDGLAIKEDEIITPMAFLQEDTNSKN